MKYTLNNITITYDPLEKHLPFVQDLIENFYIKLQKKKINYSVVENLKMNIIKFPNVPEFKNYLVEAYSKMNKHEQKLTVLKQMNEAHPDYLFGISQLVQHYLQQKELEKSLELWKNIENIAEFYPDRSTFHVMEILAFYCTLADIKIEIKEWDDAEEIIEMLEEEFGDEVVEIHYLRKKIYIAKIENGFFESSSDRIEPKVIKQLAETSSTSLPDLENVIVYDLYKEYGIISKELSDKILQCERKSLIRDLIKILEDTEKRWTYFLDNEDSGEENIFINSLLLLKELKAEEVLEKVLEFLKNDEIYYELWAEYNMEYLWQVIFVLGKNKVQSLTNFIKEPGIYAWFKTSVNEALTQIYLHFPDYRENIEDFWEDFLHIAINSGEDDNIISLDFNALFIGAIYGAKHSRYLPLIEKLYEMERVDKLLYGKFKNFVKDYTNPDKMKILSLEQIIEENVLDLD